MKFMRVAQDFLWELSGVLALLGLTGAVVGGLIATDRLVLYSEHRLLFQTLHRSAAIGSVGFLFAHVTLQIAFGQAGIANVLSPFGLNVAVAFGVIASDLMLVIIITGIMRRRFASGTRPRVWRLIHATAYLCWPFAIVHGLTAGRAPNGWVILGYALCLLAVGLALVLRMAVILRGGNPRRNAEEASGRRREHSAEQTAVEQPVRERERRVGVQAGQEWEQPLGGAQPNREQERTVGVQAGQEWERPLGAQPGQEQRTVGMQAGQQRERPFGAENNWARDRTITTPQPKVPDDILDVGSAAEGSALQNDLEFWSTIRGERN
ncbi:ferric reductase-like transmembrane domain-containing protein [Allosalinactinospora lopnorensis]|uniref:ferric reductase-like transmembrane domain-containing protein n=1 Tax=Allosalinactinospora lopnorensis TaxID=1352348 RepID=UPI0012E1ADC4|nr:ferric reductase-like transmembrane domain-containing protein [Allosalinactinospora lopnorensis]